MNAWGIQSVIDGEGLWRVFLASYAPLFDTYQRRRNVTKCVWGGGTSDGPNTVMQATPK